MKRSSTSLLTRDCKPKHFVLTRIAVTFLEMENHKFWQGGTEIGTLVCCWWECKMVWTLKNSLTVSRKVRHRITIWSHHSTIRDTPPKNWKWVRKQQPDHAVTAALTMEQTEEPKCSSGGEWINKMWSILTVENDSATKRNEVLTRAAMRVNLKNLPLCAVSKRANPETESGRVVASDVGGRREGGLHGSECSSGEGRCFGTRQTARAPQTRGRPKCRGTVGYTTVNSMAWEFHLYWKRRLCREGGNIKSLVLSFQLREKHVSYWQYRKKVREEINTREFLYWGASLCLFSLHIYVVLENEETDTHVSGHQLSHSSLFLPS